MGGGSGSNKVKSWKERVPPVVWFLFLFNQLWKDTRHRGQCWRVRKREAAEQPFQTGTETVSCPPCRPRHCRPNCILMGTGLKCNGHAVPACPSNCLQFLLEDFSQPLTVRTFLGKAAKSSQGTSYLGCARSNTSLQHGLVSELIMLHDV